MLLYCEGDDEVQCAKHIRSLCERENFKVTKIRNGHGGSPLETVRKAINDRAGYDEVCVWIDTDREETEAAIALANAEGITVISNTPDIEASMLKFHDIKLKPHLTPKQHYRIHFPGKDLGESQTYRIFFPTAESLQKPDTPFLHICSIIF